MKKAAKILTVALSAAMLTGTVSLSAFPVSAETESLTNPSVIRISHPDNIPGQADGLVPEGDRETSYAWCMAQRGDYVYIGTNKNIGGMVIGAFTESLMAKGLSRQTILAMADVVSGGTVPHPTTTVGGQILRVNCLTNEIEVIYTAPAGTSFRMAITHGDNVFFGSYGTTNDIFRINANDEIETVYSTTNGTSMRAACEFDGKLFFGGVDQSETIDEGWEGSAKLAVLTMDENDNSVWNRVADYKDFGKLYATDPMMSSVVTSPIWDICTYQGEIYATLPSMAGFAVFKGHPARTGETANAYGWTWQEVVGYTNGINPIGLNPDAKTEEVDTEQYMDTSTPSDISMVATPFVFKNELYLFDFDNTLGAEATAIRGFLQQLSGADLKPSDYLSQMYNTLRHTQCLWKLNNETGKFEKIDSFSELLEDTTVEYVWRAEEFNDEMYITTMDSATIYNYITKLTNGSFVTMTKEEWKQQIGYIETLVASILVDKSEKAAEIKTKLTEYAAQLKELYNQLSDNEDIQAFVTKFNAILDQVSTALNELKIELAQQTFIQNISARIQNLRLLSKAKKDAAIEKIQDYLLSHDLSAMICPDLDVPLSSLTDEELSAYIDALKENLGAAVESLRVEIPTLKYLTKDEIKEALSAYAAKVIDQTIGQELYEAIVNLNTAFTNKVESQISTAKTKILIKVAELYEKLPEEKQEKISEFVSTYIFGLAQKIQEEYVTKINTMLEKVKIVSQLTLGDYESFANTLADTLADNAIQSIVTINEELASHGLGLSDEKLDEITGAIDASRENFKTKCAEELDKISEDRTQTPLNVVCTNIENNVMSKLAELEEKLNTVYTSVKAIYDKIDWEGLKMYAYINDKVKNDVWGFDMLKTSDGVNFEVVTNDGFGDPYNYGGRSMVSTPYGLYVGTANPFYGAQLYLLNATFTASPSLASTAIELGDQATVNLKAAGGSAPYRYSVYYKKTGASKWTLAAKETTDSTVSFKPGAAVSYDVLVKTYDSDNSVINKKLKLKVHMPLENQSRLGAETITLGESVKVRAIAKGGDGNYQYAVSYKKSNSSTWHIISNYSDKYAFGIKPGSASNYDIRVDIKDGTGTVESQTLSLTVTK